MAMSTITVGRYLETVREARRMSREAVAEKVRHRTGGSTNAVQIMRIEKGQPTGAATLAAMAEAVGADIRQMLNLLLDEQMSAEQAAQLAEAYVRRNAGTPDEQEARRLEALALIDRLLADPRLLDRLMGYGQRLLDEQSSDL